MSGIGAIGASGFDFGSGAFNIGLQAYHNIQARKWQEKMVQNQWNRDRWSLEDQRAYDHPKAQMQRFSDAGLNPHLIYGKGTHGGGQAIQKSDRPREYGKIPNLPAPRIMELIQMAKNIEKQDADIGLTNAQKDGILTNNKYLEENLTTGLDLLKERLANIGADTKNKTLQWEIANANEQIDKTLRSLRGDAEKKELETYVETGVTKQDSWKVNVAVSVLKSLGMSRDMIKNVLTGNFELPF